MVTAWPKYFSAVSFIFCKIKADIWEGEYFLPLPSTHASLLSDLIILKGTFPISFLTVSSSNDLPINLLAAKIVSCAFVTACLLAGWPTNFSSFSKKATTEGVVLAPSAFSKTLAWEPSIMATHEFVVPKSIPITLLIFKILIILYSVYGCFFSLYKVIFPLFFVLFPLFYLFSSLTRLLKLVLKVFHPACNQLAFQEEYFRYLLYHLQFQT